MPNITSVLTQQETEKVIIAVLATGPVEETTLRRAVKWAEQVRIGADLLSMVLAGTVTMEMPPDGKPMFRIKETNPCQEK